MSFYILFVPCLSLGPVLHDLHGRAFSSLGVLLLCEHFLFVSSWFSFTYANIGHEDSRRLLVTAALVLVHSSVSSVSSV